MAYTEKYYSKDLQKSTNGVTFYKEDVNGGAIGLEFIKDGVTYLVVGGGWFPNFSTDNREADVVFRKYVKADGIYGYIKEYRRTVSDNSYMYGNPLQPNFGQYEDNPFEADGLTLKSEDLETEAQFFIDNIMKNVYNLPVSLLSFVKQTIIRVEGL